MQGKYAAQPRQLECFALFFLARSVAIKAPKCPMLELLKQQARSFLAEDNSLISAGDRRLTTSGNREHTSANVTPLPTYPLWSKNPSRSCENLGQ